MNSQFNAFKKQIINPIRFRLFLLGNLPAAFFAGLGIVSLSEQQSIISVNQKWFNKNPFQSIYFAVLSMAAEMSTGLLCGGHIYKRIPSVSILVTKIEGTFIKKATGKIFFICKDGDTISQLVEDAIISGQSLSIRCLSTGCNQKKEVIAEFYITWSFKARSK